MREVFARPTLSGSGALPSPRPLALLTAAVVAVLAIWSAPASAEYIHGPSSAEFGPTGASSPGFGNLNTLVYQQTEKKLYALADNSIYGFGNPSAGTLTPLGGSFPIGVSSSSQDSDIAVDNSATGSAGHIIYNADGPNIVGYSSAGSSLGIHDQHRQRELRRRRRQRRPYLGRQLRQRKHGRVAGRRRFRDRDVPARRVTRPALQDRRRQLEQRRLPVQLRTGQASPSTRKRAATRPSRALGRALEQLQDRGQRDQARRSTSAARTATKSPPTTRRPARCSRPSTKPERVRRQGHRRPGLHRHGLPRQLERQDLRTEGDLGPEIDHRRTDR